MSDAAPTPTPDATATPTAPAATPPATPPAAAPANAWLEGLNDDSKGFIQNKGFRGTHDLLDSYRNLEKLVGVPKERLLKLPEKDDDPAWSDIYHKLGTPKDPKEYKIAVPEGADPKFGEWARGLFGELKLTGKQAEGLTTKWNEFHKGQEAAAREAFKQRSAAEETELKNKWGSAYNQNVDFAKNAASALGIDGDTIDRMEGVMGFAKVMELFQKIGAKTGESKFVNDGSGGGGGFNSLTPEGARNRIATLKADKEFAAKYIAGDTKAKEEMERLHIIAYPTNPTT